MLRSHALLRLVSFLTTAGLGRKRTNTTTTTGYGSHVAAQPVQPSERAVGGGGGGSLVVVASRATPRHVADAVDTVLVVAVPIATLGVDVVVVVVARDFGRQDAAQARGVALQASQLREEGVERGGQSGRHRATRQVPVLGECALQHAAHQRAPLDVRLSLLVRAQAAHGAALPRALHRGHVADSAHPVRSARPRQRQGRPLRHHIQVAESLPEARLSDHQNARPLVLQLRSGTRLAQQR